MKTLRLIFYPLACVAGIYLLFSFGNANFNIAEWDSKTRGSCVFFMFTFSLASIAIADIKNNTYF